MPQDAFTIGFIADELNNILRGGKISRITQPGRDDIIFIIYTAEGTVKLEMCLSAKWCRINLTDREAPAPKTAPGFCMLLRKHLQNAKITKIEQIPGERIVYFDFECVSEFELTEMRLYVELMGKYSNAVLTKDGVISGALKTTSIGENTKRVLFTGVKYALPEPQDKISPQSLCEIRNLLENDYSDKAKLLADGIRGIAYSTAHEIVQSFNGNPCAEDVNRYICGGQKNPCVVFTEGKPTDFKVRSVEKNKISYDSVLKAQTAYYDYVTERRDFEEEKSRLSSALNSSVKKLEKRLASIYSKLDECADAEETKLKGELITANIYALKRGMDSFEAVNYYDENGGKLQIRLDKTLSPADNAQKYYKKYAKLKRTAAAVGLQKSETEENLRYLNSIATHIYAAECLEDLRETAQELQNSGLIKSRDDGKKKQIATSPFREFSKDGFRIICGRNNLQNDRLLKSAAADDLWLHTHTYHSSHVVIVTKGGKVPDEVLLAAAEICAYYSEGREGTKVAVDYTLRKFVRKPPKANAGFVTYTEYKNILVTPDKHDELKTE